MAPHASVGREEEKDVYRPQRTSAEADVGVEKYIGRRGGGGPDPPGLGWRSSSFAQKARTRWGGRKADLGRETSFLVREQQKKRTLSQPQ